MFWLDIAKTYDKINSIFRAVFKRNLRGVGYLLRKVKRDHVLMFHGQKMFFNHKVAGCYVGLINGKYTEIETHLFLKRIIEMIEQKINFIDVGANIGEMVLDLARYEKVKCIYAFEPHPECAKACKITMILNGYDNKSKVIQKVLSDNANPVRFIFNEKSPNASSITFEDVKEGSIVYPSTLDNELQNIEEPSILLIDVEGAEPLVLKGSQYFIKRTLPLIIFEYNDTSKKYFDLDNIRDILGNDYNIYRLRKDAYLDRNYIDTWNCVAINVNSIFYDLSKTLLKA